MSTNEVQIDVMTGDEMVTTIMGTNKPYFGEKAYRYCDPATKVVRRSIPLRTVISLFHKQAIGGATRQDVVDLIDHMTPGMGFWEGLIDERTIYCHNVIVPELQAQLPRIATVPLPKDGDLARFYQELVGRFGEMVEVNSIPKQIARTYEEYCESRRFKISSV